MFWFRGILGLIFFAHSLLGGVILDGSFGTHGALLGPNYMITAPMGRQINTNLFQSFSQFNLNSSQSATFTGPSNVRNILARVTSGGPSSIDGTIDSDIHGANLFFMNPAGVIFGQHAQLDVSGSFAVTTANYLKLVGGGRFNSNLGGQDTLTSAPVSAFGFLDQTPAAVSITGSNSTRDSSGNIVPGPGLDTAPHKSFSVVAGDIAMNAGTITGPGSRVNLVSVKSPGEVQLDATAINSAVDVTQFTALGTINLTNLALIDTNGPGGGPVVIRGGNLSLNDSQVSSETMGAIQGGAIDIALLADLQMANLGSIVADTLSGGKGGDLSIHAGAVVIQGTATPSAFTGIAVTSGGITTPSSSHATGDAGDLTIDVDHAVSILPGGQISTTTFSDGNAGSLSINAESLVIHGIIHGSTPPSAFTGIVADSGGITAANSNAGAKGNAGNVTITVGGALSVVAGSVIGSTTFSRGNAGDLSIHAGSLLIDGMADISGNSTAIASQSLNHATGNAGDVTLTVDGALDIASGSGINTATQTSGRGGDITINAGSLLIDNSLTDGSPTSLPTLKKPVDLLTGITAATPIGTGNAGNITITVAGALRMVGHGQISDGTTRTSTGDGGNITIQAGSLSIDDTGTDVTGTDATGMPIISPIRRDDISAETRGSGTAGNIKITVNGALSIAGSGDIAVSTISLRSDRPNDKPKGISSGIAGDLTIHAGSLSIDGSAIPGTFTGIAAFSETDGVDSESKTTDSAGNAGNVDIIVAGEVKMKGGGITSSSTLTPNSIASTPFGAAGSVKLVSEGTIRLMDDSSVSVSGVVNAGDIIIKAPVLVSLINSRLDATAGNNGGNITIDPIALQLKNSKINASAGHQGGHISLFTSFLVGPEEGVTSKGILLLAFNSSIAATGGRTNGTVNISSPELDLGAELITLPISLLSAESQLQERCAALLQGDFSSFISIGRGGTEPAPDELQTTF